MKKKLTKILSLLCVLAMALTMMSVPALAADDEPEVDEEGFTHEFSEAGEYSEDYDYWWKLDNEGTLTIRGNKMLNTPNYEKMPWDEQKDDIKRIEINEGIKNIGDYAFFDCSSLTAITIPSSVTSIGIGAFLRCSSLTAITIPSSVTSIDEIAFYGCSGLTAITIPSSVTSIAEHTFYDCSSLTAITIPNSVTSIGQLAFKGCSSLTAITIPDSVTSIGGGAFERCTSLTTITIPDSVTGIGNGAFAGCSSLTNIEIPSSVTNIGEYAFYNCSSLTNIMIPRSMTQIERYAFSEDSNLKNVYYAGTETEKKEINIMSEGNDSLNNATWHYEATGIPLIFTVTFDPNGGNLSSDETIKITNTDGKLNTLPTPSRDGTSFLGWYTAAEGGEKVTAETVFKANTTLYAHWPVSAAGVTLDKTTASMETGETLTLTATVEPDNADDKTVTWKSSDETVATVDANGKITALKAGKATITVTTTDGGKTASCTVTVTDKPVHEHDYKEEITKQPTCTEAGVKTLTCACDDTKTEEIPALGHDYKSEVTKPATIAEEGVRTYTCTRCDDTYTESIPKLTRPGNTGNTGNTGGTGGAWAPTIPPIIPTTPANPDTPAQPQRPGNPNNYKPATPATPENLAKDNWSISITVNGIITFKHTKPDGSASTGVRYIETSDGVGLRYVFNNDGTVVMNQNTATSANITVTVEGEMLVNGNLYYLNPNRDENDPRTCYVMADYLRIRDNYAGQTYYDKDGITFTGWMKSGNGGLRYQTRIPQPDKATDLYLIVWRVQDLPACQHPDHPGDPAYMLPAGRYFFDDEGVLVQKEGWNDGKDGKEYYTNANGMVTQERAK